MNKIYGYIIGVFVTICIYTSGSAQNISGVINHYAKVDSIIGIDKVRIDSTSNFKAGDTVIIVQMKGAIINPQYGGVDQMKSAGKYEFIAINSINPVTRIVEFRSNFINTGSLLYDAKECVQIVRVPTYDRAIVKSGGLTCKPWNGSKGGVVALIVNDTLILNDSINANTKGFLGASYTVNSGMCPTLPGLINYTLDKTDSAGLKGEGVATTSFLFKRGRGRASNAGGGGYGRFSGGGGGGNYGSGGIGGKMDESCPDPNVNSGGVGGETYSSYFGGIGSEYSDRVFMGGGGGAGTCPVVSTHTNGGTGGGIIFIIARNLVTNDKIISSAGENITVVSSNFAGAGGGGAGGTVVLAVDNFYGNLNINTLGGKGGSTNYCSGTGGGGGGGFVWLSRPSQLFSKLFFSGGQAGSTSLPPFSCTNRAYGGLSGDTAFNLVPILNGFLFNIIGASQTICYGQTPNNLSGSYPKGGNGVFKFQWQKRKKLTSTWLNISGANAKDYLPSSLFDSTEFRRVVKSFQPQWGDTVVDTSKFVVVNVIPEIKNNYIDADTSVCIGLPNIVLRGRTPTGGDASFSFRWYSKDNSSGWVAASGANNQKNYSASNSITQYYQRTIYSNICSSLSDIDTVTIYPKVIGNQIAASQMICYNYLPNPLTGLNALTGGDSNYSYKWEKSENDSASWQPVVGIDQNYAPGKIIVKTYFHRIVFSGLNNTCKDTSGWVRVKITPAINHSLNTVAGSQIKCQKVIPTPLSGSNPTDANNSNFRYQWEKSLNQTKWDSVTTVTSLNYQHPSMDTTTYFRRIVRYGALDCCKDTSSSVTITVQPSIKNNKVKSAQEICKDQIPNQLTQNSGIVGGGNGTNYNYTWWEKNGIGWQSASGANLGINYQPPVLAQTMYYRRKVVSGECIDFSDSLKINVLPTLTNNTLAGNHEVCRDLPATDLTGGFVGGGELNVYRYSWQDSIPGDSWSNITSANPNYSPGILSVAKYFRRIVKSGLNDCCISKSSPFEIRINELPTGTILAMDTSICEGNNLNVRSILSGSAPPFGLVLKGKTDQFSFANLSTNSNLLHIKPLALKDTLYIETISDSKGCLATIKTGSAIVRLVIVPNANAGLDSEICGLKYQLIATPSVGAGNWVFKTGDGSFSPSSTNANSMVTSNAYGTHYLLWREINEFCSDSDEIAITFYEQPQIPKIKDDTSVYFQFTYLLQAPIPILGYGLWSSSGADILISTPESPTSQVNNMVFGNNEFVWTVTNGVCPTVSDTMLVFVDDIKRYTGFSPNKDGRNDEFVIDGLKNASQKTIKILNRWGSIVYSSEDYNNKWNGNNNNGDILPSDTYFYVLVVDEGRVYKGFIVLKR